MHLDNHFTPSQSCLLIDHNLATYRKLLLHEQCEHLIKPHDASVRFQARFTTAMPIRLRNSLLRQEIAPEACVSGSPTGHCRCSSLHRIPPQASVNILEMFSDSPRDITGGYNMHMCHAFPFGGRRRLRSHNGRRAVRRLTSHVIEQPASRQTGIIHESVLGGKARDRLGRAEEAD